jgi:hypothetical protein
MLSLADTPHSVLLSWEVADDEAQPITPVSLIVGGATGPPPCSATSSDIFALSASRRATAARRHSSALTRTSFSARLYVSAYSKDKTKTSSSTAQLTKQHV